MLRIELDERKIDAIFAALDQCRAPGAAVGIAIRGEPVYRRGFGLASIELPVVFSTSMRMRIHSTTKQFTCLACMLLQERGELSIDDPLGKFLPELNAVTHRVTLRQLMGHVSGLRDARDICMQFTRGRTPSNAELLAFYRRIDDMNFAPGSTWSYNNNGYVLLTEVIERVTGQAFADVLREYIFEPVGMHDTLVRHLDCEYLPNSVTLHAKRPAGGYERPAAGFGYAAGAGAMVSTVDDMLRWLAHMDRPIVGNADTWALMRTPQRLSNGYSAGYALGLMIDRYRGVEILHHPGGSIGGNSQMLKVPAAGLDVSIMVNRDDVSSMRLTEQVLDACLPQLEPARQAAKRPVATGVYRSPATGRVIQLRATSALSASLPTVVREGQQIVAIDGVVELVVERGDDDVLRPAATHSDARQEVQLVGDVEHPAAIRFRDFGNVDELVAVRPPAHEAAAAIAGRYRSETTGIEAVIRASSAGARMSTGGELGSAEFALEALGQDIWFAQSPGQLVLGGILLFDAERASFQFSNYARTRALRFWRCE